MPDAEFEKTFADLAHARLRDRAPGLLDYLIGFQLLDKNEDNTHAVGVWGFKLGDEWLYAPVFFLNGQLKGDDLLYLKSQDAFVPLKENWINYLLNRRPYVLGETELQDQSELGIRQPDFNAFARPPYAGSKYASSSVRGMLDRLVDSVDANFKPFLPVVISSPGGDKRAALAQKWNLPTFIRNAGEKAARTLLHTMKKNAAFTDSVLKFYRMEDIISAAKDAFAKSAAEGDKRIENTAPAVSIMIADRANVLDLDDSMLSDDEKEQLQRDRYLVRDGRGDDEVGRVYKRQIAKTLQNPTMSCYGNVLMTNGQFERRLVVIAPKGCEYDRNPIRDRAIVVDVQNGRMVMAPPRDIFIDNEGHNSEEWQRTFDGLPEPSSVTERQKVIFVNAKGEGTSPFIVRRKVSSDGQTTFYGEFDEWPSARGSSDRVDKTTFPRYKGRHFNDSDASGWYPEVSVGGERGPSIVITNKPGSRVTQIGKDYFIPNNMKVIKLSAGMIEPWKREDQSDSYRQRRDALRAEVDEMANPQTLADIEMQLFKNAEVKELQVVTDGIEWWLRDSGKMSRPMSKLAALKQLILNYQLREVDADGILKSASRAGSPKYIIKLAQPSAPAIPEPQMATDPTLMTAPNVLYPQNDLLNANPAPMERFNAPMDMDATYRAQQAAEQGQKEVLDTSVIAGLVKTMDPDTAVDNYVGDLMLGLDRVGRILFMYYWHFDKFKDRYGTQDMPELEDNLKNVFDNLGDLTIFLKQKTIEPDVTDATAEAELEQVL